MTLPCPPLSRLLPLMLCCPSRGHISGANSPCTFQEGPPTAHGAQTPGSPLLCRGVMCVAGRSGGARALLLGVGALDPRLEVAGETGLAEFGKGVWVEPGPGPTCCRPLNPAFDSFSLSLPFFRARLIHERENPTPAPTKQRPITPPPGQTSPPTGGPCNTPQLGVPPQIP